MTRQCSDSLNNILENLLTNFLVEKPCKVINVHSQYLVDIEYYTNNQSDILYKVPIKHIQTQNAYIYFGIKEGDRGTVRFFDDNISEYLKNSGIISTETEKHGINNNLFSPGFYPSKEQYLFPQGDIVIGTTKGSLIQITDEAININGGDITIEGGNITISGNTQIDGKAFLTHKHSNGNNGNPTGAVI